MDALVSLNPSLPSEMERKHGVHMTGYCKGSSKIQFYGPASGIEESHDEIKSLACNLKDVRVDLEEAFPMDRLDSMQKELGDAGVYISFPKSSDRKTVLLYHFSHPDIAKIVQIVRSSLLSVKVIPCKPEEVLFLQCCSKISTLTNVSFDEESVVLRGSFSSIEHAEGELRSVLEGLLSHTVCLACNPKFKDHTEHCMQPFEDLDRTFNCFIMNSSEAQSKTCCIFNVYIFSKNSEVYSDACKFLNQLNPGSKEYQLPEGAEGVVKEMQAKLEQEYYVHIDYTKPTVTLHGLIVSNLDQCYAELRDKVESTLPSIKLFPITSHQKLLFRTLYKKDLKELRNHCSSLSFTNEGSIQVKGTLKQTDDVERKLKSGLLSMRIYTETFPVSCESKLAKIWRRRWEQVKEKENRCSVLITYKESTKKPNCTTFDFAVIGTDNVRVKEVKEAILAEETTVKSIKLSRNALKLLLQAVKADNLKFLSHLTVHVSEINEWQKAVTVTAPKECDEDLDSAIEKIRQFVGDDVDTTTCISSSDPVVGLILHSQSLSTPYLTRAHEEAKCHEATISLLERPSIGLQISGSKSSIEIARPIIHSLTIAAIEKSIVQKQINIRSVYGPVLTTPDFSRLKSKLEDKFCTTCSLPTENLNVLICTSHLQLPGRKESLQIDIVKGDITLEHVDVIVNAANEELKHRGGLAKAIVDAGGLEIQSECDTHIKDHSNLKPGDVLYMSPGRLPCKCVIHAVGPRWKEGEDDEEEILHSAVFNCLEIAGKGQLTSIAIPAISTGIFNVPVDICAKASVKALGDFAHDYPDTSVRKIKFVMLSQPAVDAFYLLVRSGQYQKKDPLTSPDVLKPEHLPPAPSQPSPTSSSGPTYLWKWRDDRKSFTPYSADLNHQIESAYQDNPLGSHSFVINSAIYIVDFQSMKQTNQLTGFKRSVIRERELVPHVPKPPRRSGVRWQYADDQQEFTVYSIGDSEAIEEMYQSGNVSRLIIGGRAYTFNFTTMCQINILSRHERKIRRKLPGTSSFADALSKPKSQHESQHELPSFSDTVSEAQTEKTSHILTLRGPKDSLPSAERALMTYLDSYIKQDVIKSLPDTTSAELRLTLSQIAAKNGISCSFEEFSEEDKPQTVMWKESYLEWTELPEKFTSIYLTSSLHMTSKHYQLQCMEISTPSLRRSG